MGKFFFNATEIMGERVIITGQTAHHMLHVLRFREGQGVILCDGASMDYPATLHKISDKPATLTFQLGPQAASRAEPPFHITLYQGIAKGEKMDWIIEKCIEVGVCKIVPVITARTVVKIKDATKKAERYTRIAESAAGQSMRGAIPVISPPVSLAEALAGHTATHSLVAYEGERTTTIKAALQNKIPASISIWVGPEGGFEESEVTNIASTINATPVTLGPRILRTETSGIVAISTIHCTWEGQA